MSVMTKNNSRPRRLLQAFVLCCAVMIVGLTAIPAQAAPLQKEEPAKEAKKQTTKDTKRAAEKAQKNKGKKKGQQKGKQEGKKKDQAPGKAKAQRSKPAEHNDVQLPGRGQGQRGAGKRGPGERGVGQRGQNERGFRPPPALWGRLSEQEREEVRAFVEEHFPRMYVELERLRRKNPQRFQKRMQRVVASVGELMEVMEISPERGELMLQERRLDMEIRYLSSRYKSAKDKSKREKIRKQMRELCADSFDCRHKRRAIQIREFEAKLGGLKQRHTQAQKMREQLITEQVKTRLESPGTQRGPGKGR